MNEMVERVTHAIAGKRGNCPPTEEDGFLARAAIDAMREPTEALLAVGFGVMARSGMLENPMEGADSIVLCETWQAMIAAALEEPRE